MVARSDTVRLVSAIREKGTYSQESLARELGVSFATVNAWERGRSAPRQSHLKSLHKLAESLGIRTNLMVLAIDDDPTACSIIEGLVTGSSTHAVVETTTDPSTGLILCGALEPDLLLIDVLMPGIDGFGVASRLLNIRPELMPLIVFVTASSDPEVESRAHSMGYGILRKPLRQEAIDDLLIATQTGALPAWA